MLGDRHYGGARGLRVEGHTPAKKVIRIEYPENQIGVGHSRLIATAAITGRTGTGAGALRSDAQEPAGIDPGDAATAGTNGAHINLRQSQKVIIDHRFGRDDKAA